MVEISVSPDETVFECEEGDTILRSALRAGLGMAYSCNVGSCGNCRFDLLEGSVSHLRKDSPAWTERDLKRNRFLGCQASPDGPCKIKFRADPKYSKGPRPVKRVGQLISANSITHDITEFTFDITGDDLFLPGQYALVSVDGIPGGRPYSFSNLPDSGIWQFQIRRVPNGKLTRHLFDTAKPGDTLTIDGPYGTAYLDTSCQRDIVLIAGGSGLSPMVSIARAAAKAGLLEDRKMHFFYGCRTMDDRFDPTMLTDLHPAISLIETLSDPDPDWSGSTGFVHDAVRDVMGEKLKDHEIYFAGPAIMSSSIQKMAHEAGTPMNQLHFDEFY